MADTALQDAPRDMDLMFKAPHATQSFSSTIVELSSAGIDDLEDEWNAIVARGEYSEPFFQPYWFRAFSQTFNKNRPAPFVLVRQGKLLKGVLPLMRSRRFWGKLPARTLRGLSGIHSCRFDFICDPHQSDSIAESAWRALEEDRSWNVIEAHSVPEGGAFEALMRLSLIHI